ncbi:MAG: 4Fe-4S binding protein [Cytophagales bacterium]|nr:4Fe-4S binding protein [Cytophagales bacterium]
MNNYLKKTGLWTFILGFGAFIVSLTLSDYRLSKEIISEQGTDEKYQQLSIASTEMHDVVYDTNIRFIRDLKKAIEKANHAIIEKYAIDLKIGDQLAEASGSGDQYIFKQEVIDEILPASDEILSVQNKSLKDYTGWLAGRSFTTKSKLADELKTAITSINHGLSYQRAFDSYSAKNLVFAITKASSSGMLKGNLNAWFFLSFGLVIIGAFAYFYGTYSKVPAGIKNNHIFLDALTNKGWLGIALGTFMIAFYIVLYFYPEYLTNWVLLVDPVSYKLNGGPASHWFLYGFMYTTAVFVMGIRMILKYRHNVYQIIRTVSVIFFQTAIAFILPEILVALHKPGYDFKNIWPLDYDFFYSYNLTALTESGMLGWFMLFWGIALILIAVPVITYFYGKRWYCSWVCGCGGLAETLGDPFRQLSDKSLKAWKIERWMIHAVLVYAVINTCAVLYTFFTGSYSLLGIGTESIKTSYGFLISSMFAGVIGTGFYPLMGNRVWCRFGCPLAAYLGLVQRFKSRFRITTNGGQCISCGNCSTYCEMGIDVRWYAQRGQNIVRSSCVGCGICSAVCPRGVLRLENGPEKDRLNVAKLIGNERIPTSN